MKGTQEVQIIVDTEKLSEQDKAVLHLILGNGVVASGAAVIGEENTPAEAVPTRRRRQRRTAPEPEAAAEESEEASEPRSSSSGGEYAEAVALASELVSQGRRNEVKAVLSNLKLERVSNLSTADPDLIEQFIKDLKNL